VQYDVAIVIVVINNGMYGTIRMHQERRFPGRVSGTNLKNPDFAALARAYGAHGEVVATTSDFEVAFEQAVSSNRPALLELRMNPEEITPRTSLTSIRMQAITSSLLP
jgi:acetolactate synthase-1/2/3 large subunit